jgi:hypothetical protein
MGQRFTRGCKRATCPLHCRVTSGRRRGLSTSASIFGKPVTTPVRIFPDVVSRSRLANYDKQPTALNLH